MTPSRAKRPPARGSTLLLAMILLGVLSVIAVAAVTLSSQERTNAALKTSRDRLAACATAAQAAIWSEFLAYGPNYLASGQAVPEIQLGDGTRLRAGHYKDAGVVVISTAARVVGCRDPQTETYVDLTNRDSFFEQSGRCLVFTARCVDSHGRELEVEFGVNTLF
jgi:Tfp pilus assembly protein PilX